MSPTRFETYFAAQQHNLEQIRRLPHFISLVEPLAELYDLSVRLFPTNSPTYFGRLLLVCDRAYMSAAALIGRAQPDDAGGVTRRAIEAACLARAVKHDRQNIRRWQAFEERLARWEARRVGAKPKPLKTTTLDPPDHPFVKSLRRQVGVLSDAAVHFTPEFLDRQTWRRTQDSDNAEWIRLLYFEPSQRVLERELLSLIGTHLTIAVLFDECVDGAFRVNGGWAKLHDEIAGRANALVDRFNKAKKRWKAEDGRPS